MSVGKVSSLTNPTSPPLFASLSHFYANMELYCRIGYGDKNARRSRKSSQPTKVADLPAIPSRSRSDDSSSSFPFVASPGESSQSAGVSPPPAYAPPTPPAARKFSLGRKMTLTAGKKKAESPSKTSSLIPPVEKQLDPQDSCIQLSGAQIDRPDLDGFRPVAAIIFPTGTTTCLAMSDIGFVALSADANLVIVDLRGPEVLWLEDVDGAKSGKGKGKRSDSRPITSLTWAIGAVGDGWYCCFRYVTNLSDFFSFFFALTIHRPRS